MRRLSAATLLAVAGLFGCGPSQQAAPPRQTAAFVPPLPSPPAQHAPVCVRPAEKQALQISALVSQLQVITTTCHVEAKYNQAIPPLRPTLSGNERTLNTFFSRAYGNRSQKVHDDYITELANLQSELGLKSGDQFCRLNEGMLDEIIAMKNPAAELPTYAAAKPIQQGMAADECPPPRATPAPAPKPAPKKK